MKKILTMMMVMLIAVTAVFAETTVSNPTNVKINYTVNEKFVPSFQIVGTHNEANTTATTGDLVISAGAGDGVFTTDFVDFKFQDKSYVNQSSEKNYVVTITPAAKFVGTLSDSSTVDGPAVEFSNLAVVTTGSDTWSVAKDDSAKKVTVTFVAHKVTDHVGTEATPISPVDAASFKLSWVGGNYPVGDYVATTTIAVSAN